MQQALLIVFIQHEWNHFLDKQITQAKAIDQNDIKLVNLENRLHNLSLDVAELEKEKRDVKWKVS